MKPKAIKPTEIKAQGNKPKIIQEFIGRVNSRTEQVSIARMNSPEGWSESGQTPDFDEYTVVLSGTLHVKTKKESYEVKAGEAFTSPWLSLHRHEIKPNRISLS